MAENNRGHHLCAAANDDELPSPACTARVAASIDDPCADAGYDGACRDENGQLCRFHDAHCQPPDYPCLDMLRHVLAIRFLEGIARAGGDHAV
jgi:hypothetical protein